MSNWGFWGWLSYICIGISAIMIAVDKAVKGSPEMLKRLSGLLSSALWNYAPLMLIGISAIFLILHQLGVVGAKSEIRPSVVKSQLTQEPQYIKTDLRLQFFGDHRIPYEVSSDNVASWFAYFSPSLAITPMDARGNTVAGGLKVPPNWAIFLALDKPAKFRQAIVTFSNPEVMPVTDVHMANSRAIVISIRGQVPAGVLSIHVIE